MEHLKSKRRVSMKRSSDRRRLEQRAYRELIDTDSKVRNLKRFRSFYEKDEENQLKRLTACWSTVAQQAADALLPSFEQEEQKFLGQSDDSTQHQLTNDFQRQEGDPMVRMLHHFCIDPEVLRYDSTKGEFM
ncbi:hypothetical protein BCR43DRAFT_522168 [Syncephalastrum racemosum]|uniref:Uncharacterized protein n=1 Tax=Syncephalastrum racemosum TaxID=13706 RepID=A0A1X2HPM2_SYNRA|nr:hypothetical protein BCR43DRAFT_522168 [Syncephalastrum racemosum]